MRPSTAWLAAVALGCADRVEPDPDPCALDRRVDGVDDALSLIDELGPPVDLACFLTALRRPLGLELTSDVFNTQPARGPTSPRILVVGDRLTMTVVPVGEARALLELGQRDPSGLTLKAELAFPIEAPVDPGYPFERTLSQPGASDTGCHVCHADEIEVAPGRFANTRLRPPDDLVVPIEVLREAHRTCDPADGADPDEGADRCAMFSALLDHGPVRERLLPESLSTQFAPAP